MMDYGSWLEIVFRKKTVVDGDTLIDKRTGEVLGPEVDYTSWRYKSHRLHRS